MSEQGEKRDPWGGVLERDSARKWSEKWVFIGEFQNLSWVGRMVQGRMLVSSQRATRHGCLPEQGKEGDHVPLKVAVDLTLLCIQGLAECKAISRCPSTVMVIVRWRVK